MTRKPGALPCASALAQARSGGRFTATHERSWQCARLRLGDRDGARALVEVLLLHPRLPFASAHAALDTATRLGAVDPALVAIEARRIADGRRESGVVGRPALSASTARRRTWPATPRSSPGARDEHAHDRAGGRADDRGDLARAARGESTRLSKSSVSRSCTELDAVVESFLARPPDGGPYRLPLARRAHSAGARGGPHRPGQPCGVSPRTREGSSPRPSTPTASARCWAAMSARARTGAWLAVPARPGGTRALRRGAGDLGAPTWSASSPTAPR